MTAQIDLVFFQSSKKIQSMIEKNTQNTTGHGFMQRNKTQRYKHGFKYYLKKQPRHLLKGYLTSY